LLAEKRGAAGRFHFLARWLGSVTVMTTPSLLICKDSRLLAALAADFVTECAQEAIEQRGRFLLVLAGGSTPEETYSLLAQPERSGAIDWPKTYFFFGDERFVPPGDDHSNYGMARRTLLAHVPVQPLQVFPVPTQAKSAAEAAARYDAELTRFFNLDSNHGTPPRFDLILLGLGEDGHTASLFPEAAALGVDDAWVTWSRPGVLPPPVDRITMTYPALNAARNVAFLVVGANKARALHDILEGHATRDDRPAAGVQLVNGAVTWLVDENAAKLLTRKGAGKERLYEERNHARLHT
jgi:6-phosphogluconolactonase